MERIAAQDEYQKGLINELNKI